MNPHALARTSTAFDDPSLFDLWRFHTFFTTGDPVLLGIAAADAAHRGHAIVEQVHADLKNSALAYLASGVFTANASWPWSRGCAR